jgi:heme O synthase-like polyprenyltransferase
MRSSAMFSTPRPEPSHLLPALGGSLVILLALPVFLVGGWSVAGWGLAAVIWVATHAIDLLLQRTRGRTDNVAASGVQAFGLFFKSVGLLAVLLAAAVARPELAVGAAVTYALAYTFELGLSLAAYFGAIRS